MKPLEQYLSQATKGLWGRKKLEVREELTAHILERAYKHEIAGISHETAVARAIEELGDPKTIRTGMIGVHTMPNVFKISGFLTVAAAGAIAMLSVSSAQITGTTRTPIVQCQDPSKVTFEVPNPNSQEPFQVPCESSVWLEINSLRKTLEPLGVKFEEWVQADMGTYKLMRYRLHFPEGGAATWQQEAGLDYGGRRDTDPVIPYLPGFVRGHTLVKALQQLSVPFSMSGWDNPTLRIGQIAFSLGTKNAPVLGQDWYRDALIPSLYNKLQELALTQTFFDSPNLMENLAKRFNTSVPYRQYKHQLKSELPSQQIVVVVERMATRETSVNNQIQVIPPTTRAYITFVKQDGAIEFPSDIKNLQFVDSLKDIKPSELNGAGTIAVLKFNNQMNLGSETFAVIPSSKLSK